VSAVTRRELAVVAFRATAEYDVAIATWMSDGGDLPAALVLSAEKAQELRYGENPHQAGARYRSAGERSWWDDSVQHGGKELSYLNVYDTEAAWSLVHRFDSPACVIVKHANPCGVAVGERLWGNRRGQSPGHRCPGHCAHTGVHRSGGGTVVRCRCTGRAR